MMLTILRIMIMLSFGANVFSDVAFPESPCPNTFSYARNSSNETYGVARFKNDLSGYYKVEVNMTLPAFTTINIVVRRFSSAEAVQNGEDIVYHVSFPPSNVLPNVASIVFNAKLYCSGIRNASPAAGSMSTLNAMHFFSTPIVSKGPLIKSHDQHTEPAAPSTTHPQTSTANIITLPNRTPPTSPLNPNLSQTSSVTVTKIVNMYLVSSDKPYMAPLDPIKTTEKLPATSGFSSNEIATGLLNDPQCGMTDSTVALVVHGSPTTEEEHPWLIAMFHLQEKSGEYKFKCAANLVSKRHVITAAHCVRTRRSTDIPRDNIILVLGKHNIRSWAVRSEIRNVQAIYVHPQYKQPSDADIALIVMSKTVEFSSLIQPVCLWMEDTNLDRIVGSNGTVIGWGKDEFNNVYVPEPKELHMPIASQEDCLRSDERFFKITSNRTFCAGTRTDAGVCSGDSGGGLVIKRNGRWTLRGIVSSALVVSQTHSCDVNNYMVFADVAKVMTWLAQIMAQSP